MPRIITLLIMTSLGFTGCLIESKSKNMHGLSSFNHSQFTYRGLAERSIQLKFKVNKNQISTVTAVIETDYDYNYPVNIEWKLGQFIQLNEGQLKQTIPFLKKNQPVSFVLKIEGFNSSENKFIRFEALGTHPHRRIFTDGIVSSQIENSFEKIVQEVEAYKKNQGDQ